MPGVTADIISAPRRKTSAAKACLRHLFKTIVTITVGPSARQFLVHKELLCARSRFFAAALNPSYSFKESSSSACHLPEARVEDFEFFVQWLYAQCLDHEELAVPHPAYFRLIRLYILADQLGVTLLKNEILEDMARLSDQWNACPTPEDTRLVYANTPDSSKLRTLVLDLFQWKTVDRLISTHEGNWDERFLRDLVVRLKQKNEGEKRFPWRLREEACRRYHEHDEVASQKGSLEQQFVCKGVAQIRDSP